MRILEENWKVLTTLFPAGWQQMAWQSGAVERLRGFPSPDVLLRMLLLHVAQGYSLRETVVRAKVANWADISDVALLKRLRNSEEWLRPLCVQLLRENAAYRLEQPFSRAIRIVDGTIVRERGKTGSQWRILYSIRLPSLVRDFFEVTTTIVEGSGESLKRLPVSPHELILADAGYCSVAGIEYVWQHGADVLDHVVRHVNSVSHFTRSRKLSNRTSPCGKRSRVRKSTSVTRALSFWRHSLFQSQFLLTPKFRCALAGNRGRRCGTSGSRRAPAECDACRASSGVL